MRSEESQNKLMKILVENLGSEGSSMASRCKIQLLTIAKLDLLFQADTDKYTLIFEESGGIDPLEDLQ